MKKLHAAMLAALLCACIAATGACEAALAFKPGDYAGEADGFGGKLTVNVTVDESSITAIEVTSHAETSGIGTNALDSLPGKIIDQQTLAVDAVAGCTVSSNALLAAVRDALDESGVDMLGDIVKKEKERGAVLIVSSHDRDILEDISDEIYDLEQGEIVRHSIKGEKRSEG